MPGKTDIVESVTARMNNGVTKKQTTEIIEEAFAAITKMLKKGERVTVPDFGSFSVSKRAARMGRNPATGEAIKIKASKNVRFKSGTSLKSAVNRGR